MHSLLPANIADSVLLGLAVLADADAETQVLEASVQDTVVGLLSVAKMALTEVMAATGEKAGAALSGVRANGLKMAGTDFTESAETLWAAGFLEASCEWPDVYAGNAAVALHYGAAGFTSVATFLLAMAAGQRGVTEQDVIDSYRARAIESLAGA